MPSNSEFASSLVLLALFTSAALAVAFARWAFRHANRVFELTQSQVSRSLDNWAARCAGESGRLTRLVAKATAFREDVAVLDVAEPGPRPLREWFLAFPADIDDLMERTTRLGADVQFWAEQVEPPLRWLVSIAERARNSPTSPDGLLTLDGKARYSREVHRALDALEGMIAWCRRRQVALGTQHSLAQQATANLPTKR
ncbi:MAG: hypothetical protein ACHQ2E_09790 [Gemmatimonadales bacterium]